jgi:hypothetical protein
MHQKEAGSCHSHKNNNDYLHPVTRPFPPLALLSGLCLERGGKTALYCVSHVQKIRNHLSFPPPPPFPSHAPQSFHYNLHKDDMSASSGLDLDPAI